MGINGACERLQQERAKLQRSAAYTRLEQLFDQGSFQELDAFSKEKDHPAEAVIGFGYIDGAPAYAFSQDHAQCGGAMGMAQASKIRKVYDLAEKTGLPIIGIYDSEGAYLLEGVDALAAYGELIVQANRLSGIVPQISLVLGPCTGCAALMAAGADVVVIKEGASLFLSTAAKVNGEKQGAGEAQSVCKNGTAQLLVKDEQQAIAKARELFSLLPLNNLSPVPAAQSVEAAAQGSLLETLCDVGSVFELSEQFGPEMHTVLARIGGVTCGIVAMDAAVSSHVGQDAAAKAARFIRFCDSFAIPVVTLVDAEGFQRDPEAEFSRSVRNAAMTASAYAEATTPKISVVTGKAYGPIFTIFAGKGCNADLVFALPQAEISALAPDAAVTILWNDRLKQGEDGQALAREYAENEAAPYLAAAKGYVDDIVEKEALRSKLMVALEMLSGKRVATLAKKHCNMPL